MSGYRIFHTLRWRQSDVKNPIFEKLIQGFLKVPENGLQLLHLHAEWINSLKKAPFIVVVASWCSQHHCWQSYVTVFKDLLLLSRYLSSNVAHFFFFLCAHSSSCRESIRDVGTHPMTPKQCLEHRLIFKDERGKVLSKKSLVMNELRQKWSVHRMNARTR
jgi:hypothetical protein